MHCRNFEVEPVRDTQFISGQTPMNGDGAAAPDGPKTGTPSAHPDFMQRPGK